MFFYWLVLKCKNLSEINRLYPSNLNGPDSASVIFVSQKEKHETLKPDFANSWLNILNLSKFDLKPSMFSPTSENLSIFLKTDFVVSINCCRL